MIEKQNTEQSLVARAILDNYLETRANAARWSGVYWGFTFAAAVLSALAGLILKLETMVKNEGVKKDVAAAFAVAAALLITIRTGPMPAPFSHRSDRRFSGDISLSLAETRTGRTAPRLQGRRLSDRTLWRFA